MKIADSDTVPVPNTRQEQNLQDCASRDLEQRRMKLMPRPAVSSVLPENISHNCILQIFVYPFEQ